MMKFYLFLLLVSVTIVLSASPEECDTKSGTDCEKCVDIKGCAFCDKNKKCFPASIIPSSDTCDLEDLHKGICFANAKTLAIILGCVGGVVLIAIIVVIVCVCRKCKQRKLFKEQKREALAEQNRQDRRAAAEIRSSDRARAADELRMKYGILREKESASDYKRFS